MTLALVLLAAGVWCSGGAAPRRPRAHAVTPGRARLASGRPIVAAVAVAIACLAASPSFAGAALGLVCAPAAVLVVRWLEARQRDSIPAADLAWLPLVLDLVAAGLMSGLPLSAALAAAAPDERPWLGAQLRQVAGMLRLGAVPAQAWQALADGRHLRSVAVTAIRGATSGIKLAAGMTELAHDLRAGARSAVQTKAQRAGVWVIAPLGFCFLPAFVCLGIAPVVIGILDALRANTPL
jgi:Flp pilus assembly protein TadB